MIKVIAFKPMHVGMIKAHRYYDRNWAERVMKLETCNGVFSYTFLLDGKVIALAGGILLNPKVMSMWTILSDDVKRCKIAFHKRIRGILSWFFRSLHLHRMHAEVRADFDMGLKWIEALGFKVEGHVRRYDEDGNDYFIYGRLQ